MAQVFVDLVVLNPDAVSDTLRTAYVYQDTVDVDVLVANPDVQEDTETDGFTYDLEYATGPVPRVGEVTTQDADGDSFNLPFSSYAIGDLGIILVSLRGTNTITISGWTELDQDDALSNVVTGTGGRGGYAVFWRRMTGVEGASVLIEGTDGIGGTLAAPIFVRPESPDDAFGIADFAVWAAGASGTALTFPSVATALTDDLVVMAAFLADDTTSTDPSGSTPTVGLYAGVETQLGADCALWIWSGSAVADEATGARSATAGAAAWHRTITLVVSTSGERATVTEEGAGQDSVSSAVNVTFADQIGAGEDTITYEVVSPIGLITEEGAGEDTPSAYASALAIVTEEGAGEDTVTSAVTGVGGVTVTDLGKGQDLAGANVGSDVGVVTEEGAGEDTITLGQLTVSAIVTEEGAGEDTLTYLGEGSAPTVTEYGLGEESITVAVPLATKIATVLGAGFDAIYATLARLATDEGAGEDLATSSGPPARNLVAVVEAGPQVILTWTLTGLDGSQTDQSVERRDLSVSGAFAEIDTVGDGTTLTYTDVGPFINRHRYEYRIVIVGGLSDGRASDPATAFGVPPHSGRGLLQRLIRGF